MNIGTNYHNVQNMSNRQLYYKSVFFLLFLCASNSRIALALLAGPKEITLIYKFYCPFGTFFGWRQNWPFT